MSKDAKLLRGQVRQVVQEILPSVLTTELVAAVEKTLTESQGSFHKTLEALLNSRLDRIEAECNKSLKKADDRARAVQSFLVQGAVKEINDHQQNTHITMLAWQEIMAEKIGNIEEFNKEIDARKSAIAQRLRDEAEARMAARTQAKVGDSATPESQPAAEPAK